MHSEDPADTVTAGNVGDGDTGTVTTGVVREGETGTVAVPAGPGEYVVHPATENAVMQMTRSTIAFRSIHRPWCQDLINRTVTANFFARMAAARQCPVIPLHGSPGASFFRYAGARTVCGYHKAEFL